jgi:hypothetical protein
MRMNAPCAHDDFDLVRNELAISMRFSHGALPDEG